MFLSVTPCGAASFVRMSLPLPMELSDGYHQVTLAFAGVEAATTLIITPPNAFVPDWVERGERQWGIACPLFSLWSDASWGIGDFSDLSSFARIAREMGASLVGLNPLHALLPGDPSPYLPSSRLFLNPDYIDVGKVLTADARQHGTGFGLDPNFAARVAQVQSARLVDYPLVYQLKQEALEAAYRSSRQDYRAKCRSNICRYAGISTSNTDGCWTASQSSARSRSGLAPFPGISGPRICGRRNQPELRGSRRNTRIASTTMPGRSGSRIASWQARPRLRVRETVRVVCTWTSPSASVPMAPMPGPTPTPT